MITVFPDFEGPWLAVRSISIVSFFLSAETFVTTFFTSGFLQLVPIGSFFFVGWLVSWLLHVAPLGQLDFENLYE